MLESQKIHLESLKKIRALIEDLLITNKLKTDTSEVSKLVQTYMYVIEKIDQYESVIH